MTSPTTRMRTAPSCGAAMFGLLSGVSRRLGTASFIGSPAGQDRAADTVVFDAVFGHLLRLEQVASVEHDGVLQARLDLLEIGTAERLPFGDDDQRVGLLERVHRAGAEADPRQLGGGKIERQHPLRFGHRDRVCLLYTSDAADE